MMDVLALAWVVVKTYAIAAFWDVARCVGCPIYMDNEYGNPTDWAVKHQFSADIEAWAKRFKIAPGWYPALGPWAGVKAIVGHLWDGWKAQRELRKFRKKLSKATGLEFRSDRAVQEFLQFVARQQKDA